MVNSLVVRITTPTMTIVPIYFYGNSCKTKFKLEHFGHGALLAQP